MPRYGHLKWKAVYQPGKVVATGYKNGKRILVQTVETTKPASQIVLKTERQSIQADGRDVAVVSVEIQDSKGRVVPDACPMLRFQLEGDAHILGAGNGDPAYLGADHPKDIHCKDFSIPAFNGLAQVLIQSGQKAGSIKLTCTSENLKNGTMVVNEK